ncbi:MAG: prepilin-type N-terminal cleavage/methylation domain-containing protein [Proteobacteria bacterium]|nr:prepilin-type N-terminal cleavage/methylation domain-containing protein [Pseudomonadota bacterium]
MSFFKRMTKNAAQKGFSLVELMVVVAIIGVLASLAVPKFQVFQAKAKQSEAKNNLSHIYTLEQTYFGDWDTFTALANLGFVTQGGGRNNTNRYTYTTPASSAAAFTAQAAATSTNVIAASCGLTDTWTITETKTLLNTVNCAR